MTQPTKPTPEETLALWDKGEIPGEDVYLAEALRSLAQPMKDAIAAALLAREVILPRLLHGDDAHRKWLEDEIAFIFAPFDRAKVALEQHLGVESLIESPRIDCPHHSPEKETQVVYRLREKLSPLELGFVLDGSWCQWCFDGLGEPIGHPRNCAACKAEREMGGKS